MEEKRLIDANAFLKDILTAGIGKTIIEYSESDIAYMIRKRPTVDAVEVVRCKDCKYWEKAGSKGRNSIEDLQWIGVCKFTNCCRREMDFCSYGERRTDG